AISVHIARRADRVAKEGLALIPLGRPVGIDRGAAAAQPICRAIPDENAPLVRFAAVIAPGADDDVRIAITIHIASSPHVRAELRARGAAGLIALRRPIGGGGEAGGAPIVDENP